MSLPTVCLYLTGTPTAQVVREHGAYDDWFAPLFAQHAVNVECFDGTSGHLPDDRARFAGVVISGSPASVTRPEPWMEAAIEWIREAYETRTPLLGVCFGHQLIGAAFGASVVRNPAGWNTSTRMTNVLPSGRGDPLFDGLPERFAVNVNHQDIVDAHTLSPMNGIRVVASNERAPAFAVAAGPSVRGVQFHPEITAPISRALIGLYRADLERDAERHARVDESPEALAERARDAPDGAQVFHNFLRHFVLSA